MTAVAVTRCADCPPNGPCPDVLYRVREQNGHLVELCDHHAWQRVPRDYFPWQPPIRCPGCGRSVIRAPRIAGEYCSTACADVARRRRQKERRRREAECRRQERAERTCEGCGELFMPVQPTQTTCKPSCRLAAWRKRVAEQLASGSLLLPLRERAHMGNPDVCDWCPQCKENALSRKGLCIWCDTPIGGDRNAVAA